MLQHSTHIPKTIFFFLLFNERLPFLHQTRACTCDRRKGRHHRGIRFCRHVREEFGEIARTAGVPAGVKPQFSHVRPKSECNIERGVGTGEGNHAWVVEMRGNGVEGGGCGRTGDGDGGDGFVDGIGLGMMTMSFIIRLIMNRERRENDMIQAH